MKLYGKGPLNYRILYSRQYALKMIANVTYGYTGAGFSGRMPGVEIADAIVAFGRQTLEASMKYATSREGSQEIGDDIVPEIVYGDTDSLFVKFPGATVKQAYEYSQKIIKKITNMNPHPMELKFEKVYFPCMTLAKK